MDDATGLFREHRAALERRVARITGDKEDARDVVADAFLALLCTGPSDREHAVSWLYLAVRRRAANRARDRRRARRLLATMATESDAASGPPVADDTSIAALLAGAVGDLSPRYQTAIVLRDLQEQSYEDVAIALETTTAQARVIVHRARARLRRRIVSVLAQRHSISTSCAESLATTGAHQDCARCTNVRDEIVALFHHGGAIGLASSNRFVEVARGWWHRAHVAAGRAALSLGDAVAPVAVAVVATFGVVGPVHAPLVAGSTSSAAAAVTSAAERTATSVSSAGSPGPRDRSSSAETVSISASAPGPAPGAVVGDVARSEDSATYGTSGTAAIVAEQPRDFVRLLGQGHVLDPLDAQDGPQVDIRSVEIAALAGHDGAVGALRVRVTFEEPPPAGMVPTFGWKYADTGCTTGVRPDMPATALGTTCRAISSDLVSYSDGSGPTSPVDVRREGVVFEVTIPFERLDERSRQVLRPGAQLRQITANISCNVLRSSCQGDAAPDHRRFEYRVPD